MDYGAQFSWIDFYMEFADKLREYAENREALIVKIQRVYDRIGMKLPKLERDWIIIDIDPFTIFGLFNKGITEKNRIKIIRGMAEEFHIQSTVPSSFEGIPVVMNLSASFYFFKGQRNEDDIDNLWGVFLAALDYSSDHSADSKNRFIHYYNAALKQKMVKWNLTVALYWIRPYEYLNLDSRNRWFMAEREQDKLPARITQQIGALKVPPAAEHYLDLIGLTKSELNTRNHPYTNFPELSYSAWTISEQVNKENRAKAQESERDTAGKALADQNIDTVHYWIYSPGENARLWDEFYDAGIMAIGWGEIGDLRALHSKEEMKQALKQEFGGSLSYKNSANATWQFANEMKPGDIVFAKKGMHTLIGRGVVSSDYEFQPEREDSYKSMRAVTWTHKGEWPHPGQAVMKTLTDITNYTEYVEKLEALFSEDAPEETEEREILYPTYTPEDFLSEVYMDADHYQVLTNLLLRKKNVILQGAPGVGKTFAAKRLAYSMIGKRNPEQVTMIQFHQSYSYEDFVMGFRPSEHGFVLSEGPFYDFCKKAEADSDNKYFFIIDEINRGNLSKIFGELFMLIENDKRGIPLQLLYSKEKFAVPKNVYLIGMMNTADRSLALLDYALRRRFAFFEMPPAFNTEGFAAYCASKNSEKFSKLIAAVTQLNQVIAGDETLGRGFCIGHSYFCTEEEITDLWLDSVITYELLPLLQEYWFDEPAKVRNWEYTLREAIR